MPFATYSPGPLQLSPGTHGLWSASSGGTAIGVLHVTPTREIWHWNNTNDPLFPTTFYIRTDANVFASPSVLEYLQKSLNWTSSTSVVIPSDARVWEIKRGTSTTVIGWLALDKATSTKNNLHWYLKKGEVDFGCIQNDNGDYLTFAASTTALTAVDCNYAMAQRIAP